MPRNRIRFERLALTGRPDDIELVALAGLQAGNEKLPDPGRISQAHGMAAVVPGIEVAHDGDSPRIGRPYRKADALSRPPQRLAAHRTYPPRPKCLPSLKRCRSRSPSKRPKA